MYKPPSPPSAPSPFVVFFASSEPLIAAKMANNPSLPRDVLLEILSRLPIKSIMRFRCVSRSWYSLITNPIFIALHLRRSSPAGGLLFNYRTLISRQEHYTLLSGRTLSERTKLDFPFHESFRIVDSSNGLICLLRLRNNPFTREITLWNPAIKKAKNILHKIDEVNRDFAIGFGFIPEANEYKVVQILFHQVRNSKSVLDQAEIYSLKSDCWRRIGVDFDVDGVFSFPTHVYPKAFVNGAVHWMAMKEMNKGKGSYSELILCFDLKEEVFREMLLPGCESGGSKPYYSVLACGDSLGVFLHHRDRADERWEMWSMVEYGNGESWMKLFVITRPEILFPLGYVNDRTVVLVTNSKQVVLYDPVEHRIRGVDLHGLLDVFRAVTYVESIALLDQ